jgi:hypothetical protein
VATAYPLPDVAKIKEVLGMLFDNLDVKPGGKFDQSPTGGAWFGVFVTDAGVPVALCGADANLAAMLGTALSMLPPAAGKEAAKAHELTQPMTDNLREIMNICTRLVMNDTVPHLRLEQIYSRKLLPLPCATLLAAPNGHKEFEVQVQRYGGGVLSLVST